MNVTYEEDGEIIPEEMDEEEEEEDNEDIIEGREKEEREWVAQERYVCGYC